MAATDVAGVHARAPAKVTLEAISFRRSSGRMLAGKLTRPSVDSNCVVLLLHGLLSNMDHNFAPVLGDRISRELGVNTFRFDFRSSPSELEPDFRYRFCGFPEDMDDTECAISFLSERGLKVVGIVGHSRGGSLVLMYGGQHAAETTEPAPSLVALAPRFRMNGMLDKFTADQLQAADASGSFNWTIKGSGFTGDILVTRDDVSYVRALDMEALVRATPPTTPLLLVHGAADKTIPADDSKLVAEVRPASELHIISGTNHTFQGSKASEKLISTVIDFLRRTAPGLPAEVRHARVSAPSAASDEAITPVVPSASAASPTSSLSPSALVAKPVKPRGDTKKASAAGQQHQKSGEKKQEKPSVAKAARTPKPAATESNAAGSLAASVPSATANSAAGSTADLVAFYSVAVASSSGSHERCVMLNHALNASMIELTAAGTSSLR